MIDLIIIVIYLIAVLCIGFYVGKSNKSGIKDYSVGDRKFSTPILVISMLATFIGAGRTIGDVAEVYSVGMWYVFALLGVPISRCISAALISSQLEKMQDCYSSADIIRKLYGRNPGLIAAFIGFVQCFGVVGAQILAAGYLLQTTLDIPLMMGSIVTGTVIIIYSTFGGIRAVTATDVLQFAILAVVIPSICAFNIHDIGGVNALFEHEAIKKAHVIKETDIIQYICLFCVFAIPDAAPTIIQRFLMGSSAKQVKKALWISAGIDSVIILWITMIGFIALVKFPDIESSLALPEMISQTLPPVLKGITIVGMLAVIMSTVDSILNSGSVLLVNDLIKPFASKTLSNKRYAVMLKIATLLIGALSLIVTSYMENIVNGMLYFAALNGAIVGVPLFAGLYGVIVNRKIFYISGFFGVLIFLLCYSYWDLGYISHFIEFMTCVMIFALVILYKKFRYCSKNLIKSICYGTSNKVQNYMQILIKGLVKLYHFLFSCFDSRAIEDIDGGNKYDVFIFFVSMTFTIPYVIWDFQQSIAEVVFRFIITLMSILLLVRDCMPKKFKAYLSVYWNILVLLYLPTNSIILFCTQQYTSGWGINMALSFFMLATLVEWQMFFSLLFWGITLGFSFVYLMCSTIPVFHGEFYNICTAIYILLISIGINVFFSRNRQRIWQEKLDTMYVFGSAMAHEVRAPFATLITNYRFMHNALNKLLHNTNNIASQDKELLEDLTSNAKDSLVQGLQTIDILLKASQNIIKDDSERLGFSAARLLRAAFKQYQFTASLKERISLHIIGDFQCFGVPEHLTYVIFNLLKNAEKHALISKDSKLEIYLTDNQEIVFQDTGYGIEEDDIEKIFERFYSKNRRGTGLGLAFCKMVMKNMGGDIKCESKIGNYTKFTLVFPNK